MYTQFSARKASMKLKGHPYRIVSKESAECGGAELSGLAVHSYHLTAADARLARLSGRTTSKC
jgi:hypothetical protein